MDKLCKRGHPMSGDNLYVSPKGARMCKACAELRRIGKADPVSSEGRTCPRGHVVAGDNLIKIGSRNACVACRSENAVNSRRALKAETLAAYGGKCACCGETEPDFLCIDHINGDGAEHRRSMNGVNRSGGFQIHRWLRKNDWPEGFQILCANCNLGKEFPNGCPHKRR